MRRCNRHQAVFAPNELFAQAAATYTRHGPHAGVCLAGIFASVGAADAGRVDGRVWREEAVVVGLLAMCCFPHFLVGPVGTQDYTGLTLQGDKGMCKGMCKIKFIRSRPAVLALEGLAGGPDMCGVFPAAPVSPPAGCGPGVVNFVDWRVCGSAQFWICSLKQSREATTSKAHTHSLHEHRIASISSKHTTAPCRPSHRQPSVLLWPSLQVVRCHVVGNRALRSILAPHADVLLSLFAARTQKPMVVRGESPQTLHGPAHGSITSVGIV